MRLTVVLIAAILTACDNPNPTLAPPSAIPQAVDEAAPPNTEAPPADLVIPADDASPPEEISDPDIGTRTSKVVIAEDAKRRLVSLITRRKELEKKYWDLAATVDNELHIGTLFNEIGLSEGTCYAAGILLGLDDAVRHLGVEDDVDLETMTPENAHELRVIGQKHANYAGAAEHMLEMDPDELVINWNLDCPGFHDIPRQTQVRQGKTSFYEIRNDGRVLMIRGDIEKGFADKMITALEANPSVKMVGLGSGGGYVHEALQAGLYIRDHGYGTVLWNNCYSACPLVFMAGNQREIWSPYPYLGFHQISQSDGTPVDFNDPTYRAVHRYLVQMRVDPRYVLTKMWSASPSDMANVFGYEPELCDANIATWIQRGCSSRDYRSSH